ncbi:ABC transporter ATP-binding protein [Borrelia sp. P9F1]|uniref:ATP-binding cassette domain-containing protein n=1 Tax=Borrelia sp. P9F1 TaxID=3058374 RepID=UPI002649DBA4|nr:ABC transporter ATP-binding protein [Borrelia sp. P9F1]WKC58125.1 ABC transporter ATP-binding protein [Borrelia sp. P9F1]
MSIECLDVCFFYGRHEVYSNLNLVFSKPQTYLILGKNGVGKTTLLKLISGLLKPTEGKILFNSLNVFPRNPITLESLFFIPEEFKLPNISLIEYCNSLCKLYPKFNEENFRECLLKFDLDINLEFSSSSYGQKKKGIIAIAVATDVPVLIFDEPTNGLDIASKNVFRSVISSLENKMVFITGHNVRDLVDIVDHLTVIDNKNVLFSNSISHINENYKVKIVDKLRGEELYYEEIRDGFKALYFEDGICDKAIDLEFFFLYVTSGKVRNLVNV